MDEKKAKARRGQSMTDKQIVELTEATSDWESAHCLECGQEFQYPAEAQAHREGPCGWNVIEFYDRGTEWLFRLWNNS